MGVRNLGIFQVYNRFSECIEETRIIKDASMKDHTSFKVGGNAKILVQPKSIGELVFIVSVCKSNDIKYFIMGNGSNLIVKDKGFEGVIIKLSDYFNEVTVKGECITAQAGALMAAVSLKALENGLTGLEFASGIPGSIGGAVVMNAGAYGGEMSHVIKSVKALNNVEKIIELSNEELNFGYRHSVFQEHPYIVLEAEMQMQKKDANEIRETMKALKEKRVSKQPLNFPSAGSVFKRPQGNYASKLIEEAGLKGLSIGGAKVSPQHAGFIINEGNATTEDIINLIAVVQSTVYEKYNIRLEPEVKVIGED